MKENRIAELSFELAKQIVNLVDNISVPKSSYMINQLARSGTSIGANINEAQYAHSRADFIAKFEIALKEANETIYWLKLMYETGRINEEEYKYLNNLCGKIKKMLIASCTTAKANAKK
jgi:four helix bundle protein